MREISLEDVKEPSDSATLRFGRPGQPSGADLGITCDDTRCVEKTIVDGKLDIAALKIVGRNSTHIQVEDDNFSRMGCNTSKLYAGDATDSTILSSAGASAHVTAYWYTSNGYTGRRSPAVAGEMQAPPSSTANALEARTTRSLGPSTAQVQLVQKDGKYGLSMRSKVHGNEFYPLEHRGRYDDNRGQCNGGQRRSRPNSDTRPVSSYKTTPGFVPTSTQSYYGGHSALPAASASFMVTPYVTLVFGPIVAAIALIGIACLIYRCYWGPRPCNGPTRARRDRRVNRRQRPENPESIALNSFVTASPPPYEDLPGVASTCDSPPPYSELPSVERAGDAAAAVPLLEARCPIPDDITIADIAEELKNTRSEPSNSEAMIPGRARHHSC